MFKVTVDPEIQGASIWVRWCLDRETKDILSERARGKVRLLIIITGGDFYKEHRVLAPLENIVQVLPARFPGKNTIFAAIVWDETTRELNDKYLGRYRSGMYGSSLISYPDRSTEDENPAFTRYWDDVYGLKGPITEIEVPKEIFAKEPSAREKSWVNRWFRWPAVDQCAYRRRRLIAYTIQPIAFFLLTLVTFLVLLMGSFVTLLLGFYKFEFDFSRFSGNLLSNVGPVSGREANYWYLLWHKLFSSPRAKIEVVVVDPKREQRESAKLAALNRAYLAASCLADGEEPKPPLEQRLRLSYHDLKDKVCKPFSG